VRILHSTFRRGDDVTRCELGLSDDGSVYELRTRRSGSPDGSIERFGDAVAAFQRHRSIERALLEDGWTLELFESQEIPRPKLP